MIKLKDETRIANISGSWYLRIPPSFARHLGLTEEDREHSAEAEIQDEENKKGQTYCSFWKKGN